MNNNVKTASSTPAIKKYYGVGSFQPIMVNPNGKDLGAFLNRQITSEPQYLTTKNVEGQEVKSLRIDIWGLLPAVDVKTKVTFWLEGRYDVARSGKTKMINGQGFATYVEDLSVLNKNKTWYYTENARKCIKGEDAVVEFFVKLMNWETDLSKYNTTNYVGYNVKIGWVNDDFIKNQFVILGESRFHAFVKKLDEQAFIYDDIATIKTAIEI